ncbi:MAG: hypothetical protein OEW24_00600 [Chloroflexota bacterium]|nr:hypothetical protein [Chloroflexota bacterium]
MDEVARRYLLLGLRLARHRPDLVGAYYGPPELAEAVAGEEPAPAAELHAEAMTLAGMVSELPQETPGGGRRSAWLVSQLKAMSALSRRIGGEEIRFVDLVEELLEVSVSLEPESTFQAAHRLLDSALRGSGSLRERLDRHAACTAIPRGRELAVLVALTKVMRSQSRAQLWLPEDESIVFEEAHGESWATKARYVGGGRSIVRVNCDLPVTIGRIVELAADQGYPGRHAAAAVKDVVLVVASRGELTLPVELSPQAVIAEGMASLAREVVMTDGELGYELGRLARAEGMNVDVEAELVVQRARWLLAPAVGNAALALHQDEQPREQVRSYLRDVGLIEDARLVAALARLADPLWAAHSFAHIDGRRLVGEWLETHGQTHGYGRLMAEQLTPALLREEVGVPPSLYPDSFA